MTVLPTTWMVLSGWPSRRSASRAMSVGAKCQRVRVAVRRRIPYHGKWRGEVSTAQAGLDMAKGNLGVEGGEG